MHSYTKNLSIHYLKYNRVVLTKKDFLQTAIVRNVVHFVDSADSFRERTSGTT